MLPFKNFTGINLIYRIDESWTQKCHHRLCQLSRESSQIDLFLCGMWLVRSIQLMQLIFCVHSLYFLCPQLIFHKICIIIIQLIFLWEHIFNSLGSPKNLRVQKHSNSHSPCCLTVIHLFLCSYLVTTWLLLMSQCNIFKQFLWQTLSHSSQRAV